MKGFWATSLSNVPISVDSPICFTRKKVHIVDGRGFRYKIRFLHRIFNRSTGFAGCYDYSGCEVGASAFSQKSSIFQGVTSMFKKTFLAVAICAAIFVGVCNAQVEIFGINNLPAGDTNELVVFDSSNPAGFATIGSTGVVGGFTGLDFAGVNRALYGYVGFDGDLGLYEINMNTGAATAVGSVGGNNAALSDLSWNPVANAMFGVDVGGNLYEVDLNTGAQTNLGVIAGLPAGSLDVGLAHDSNGNLFVQDIGSDGIYSGTQAGVSLLHDIPVDTNFSQGITIDWSRDDTGYLAAIGNNPAFF